MEGIKAAHSVYRLQYHVVWACKYRRRILNPGASTYLRGVPGVTIEAIGFDEDHLHGVMVIPAKVQHSSSDGKAENPVIVADEEDLRVVSESVLEREYCLVAGLLRKQSRH